MKPFPLIHTLVLTRLLMRVKLVMAGGGITVKLFALVVVPPGVVTLIGPVVAPTGTIGRASGREGRVKLAVVPLMVSAVATGTAVALVVTVVLMRTLVGVPVA